MTDGPPVPRTAETLHTETATELARVDEGIRAHPFLSSLEEGRVSGEGLRAFAGEQHAIISSDRRSMMVLASRFPGPPAGDLFLALADGEGRALTHLTAFAAWLGVDDETLRNHELRPGAQAYCAYMAWIALNGSRADASLAFLVNFDAWGAGCARMREALRARFDATDDAVGFFTHFAEPPPGLRDQLHAVLDAGLRDGDSPTHAKRVARLLQAYELWFWDAVAEPA